MASNIVLPDVTLLAGEPTQNQGHDCHRTVMKDHIGGIAFHLKQFDIPVIYGPRLAMALLEGKLEEAGVADMTELRAVRPRETVRVW